MEIFALKTKLHCEDYETEVEVNAAFDVFELIIKKDTEKMIVSFEFNEAKALIQMLTLALKHHGQ